MNADPLKWNEQHLYGSSRLGMWRADTTVPSAAPVSTGTPVYDSLLLGSRTYELVNHLDNVLATISDKKIGRDDWSEGSVGLEPGSDGVIDSYIAEVLSQGDYYPGGMNMPGRQYNATTAYRYGFNGKETDKKDGVVQYDYGFRIYDPRLVRFKSVDPLTSSYPELTPYQFAGNSPITFIDLDGLEMAWRNPATGEITAAGPLTLPIGSRNNDGWILFQPPVSRPAASTPAAPAFKSTLQQGSDNLASVKAAQSQQVALRTTVVKPKVAYSVTTVSADNRPEWQRRESAERTAQILAFQKLKARVSTDPVAMNGYLSAGAIVSTVQAPVVAVEKAINNAQEGNWWGVAGNALEFGLSVAPFIPFKGGAAVTGTAYRAIPAEFAESTVKSGSFFKSGNAGRLGNDGIYANTSIEGAIAEFSYHNPGVTPAVFEVKYSVSPSLKINPPTGYYNQALPFTNGVNILQAPSLRAPGTTNLLIREGAVPGKQIK